MAEWNRSRDLCNKCNSQLYRVTDSSTGQLIAKHCKWCGEGLPTPEEQERMNQHQREAQDGYEARQIRMIKRLEFNDAVSPYHRTKWVKRGFRRKIKVKKLFLLASVSCAAVLIICLAWRVLS